MLDVLPESAWLIVITLGAAVVAVVMARGVIRYRAWRHQRSQRGTLPTD